MNPLCTYHKTGTTHAQQLVYHCLTCFEEEEETNNANIVCLSCATHCHAGHELTQVEQQNSFCDCGHNGKCLPVVGDGIFMFVPKIADLPLICTMVKKDEKTNTHSSANCVDQDTAFVPLTSSTDSNLIITVLNSSNMFARRLFMTLWESLLPDGQLDLMVIGCDNLFQSLLLLYNHLYARHLHVINTNAHVLKSLKYSQKYVKNV